MRDLTSPSGDLEPIERASADELHTLQLERLQWSLRHAYANVPHYRAAFDAAGVHPDDCKDLADLPKYPLTSKADLRGVNLFPTQIEELIMGIPALSPHFQLHLTREDRMDQLAVHVERRPGTPESDSAAAAATLSARVKSTIGVTVTTSVLAPDSIERSVGKVRRVIDHRGPR